MRYRVERSMASGRSCGEGRREEGSPTPVYKEQLHTYVRNDAVEAHSCVDTDDSGSPCKQLTKTFGSKRPAVE